MGRARIKRLKVDKKDEELHKEIDEINQRRFEEARFKAVLEKSKANQWCRSICDAHVALQDGV